MAPVRAHTNWHPPTESLIQAQIGVHLRTSQSHERIASGRAPGDSQSVLPARFFPMASRTSAVPAPLGAPHGCGSHEDGHSPRYRSLRPAAKQRPDTATDLAELTGEAAQAERSQAGDGRGVRDTDEWRDGDMEECDVKLIWF